MSQYIAQQGPGLESGTRKRTSIWNQDQGQNQDQYHGKDQDQNSYPRPEPGHLKEPEQEYGPYQEQEQ